MSQVSIIIPNYNGATFLREAIDSALNQEGVVVEVIVVDDGSTDSSREVIESYGDRIRSFFQQNKGACAARNAGLAAACSDYVLFLDADDHLYAGAVGCLYQRLSRLDRTYAVYGDARWMQDGQLAREDCTQLPGELAPIAALIGQNILTGRVLHQVSNIRAVGGFDDSLPRGQEFDLHFRMALQGVSFVHVDYDVLYYRVHFSVDRLSAKGFSGEDPDYLLRLNQRHEALLNKRYGAEWPDQVRSRMARRLWEIGRGLIREGKSGASEGYFERAKMLAPRQCVSGGRMYCLLARVLGPALAEYLGKFGRAPISRCSE